MYSIGLDVSKSSINVFISSEELDLEIENSLKALKSLYSKLKKIYKREIDKVVFVFELHFRQNHPVKGNCRSNSNPKSSLFIEFS